MQLIHLPYSLTLQSVSSFAALISSGARFGVE